MTYDFYCTWCGNKMDQDKVLFDLSPVLTGSEETEFRILKFRVTGKELEDLAAAGQTVDGGFTRCILTPENLLEYVSNVHNLHDSRIMSLTMEDIEKYITRVEWEAQNQEKVAFGDLFSEEEEDSVPVGQPEPEMPDSPAIQTLTKLCNTDSYAEDLKNELSILRGIFVREENCAFDLRLNWEPDNEGNPVLIGYTAKVGAGKGAMFVGGRICPHCGRPLSSHAGRAEHKIITFVGRKTWESHSTILALTHYALKTDHGAMEDDEIWHTSQGIDAVDSVEFLSPGEFLLRDLQHYEVGLRPVMTLPYKRDPAYSATFWLRNKYQEKSCFLTLTDIPSEFFDFSTGTLREAAVVESFPMALASDAFVLCHSGNNPGNPALEEIKLGCARIHALERLREAYQRSSDEGKGLRAQKKDMTLRAPVLLCFTECPELEHSQASENRHKKWNCFDRIACTYLLKDEKAVLDSDPVYRVVKDRLYDQMGENTYVAAMRCSAMGFIAPGAWSDRDDPALQPDEKGRIRRTRPKNIDLMMQWLLKVTGCIPVEAEYRANVDPTDRKVFRPHPLFVERTQYRTLAPWGKGLCGGAGEALARCHLFENPGKLDKRYLRSYANPLALLLYNSTGFRDNAD